MKAVGAAELAQSQDMATPSTTGDVKKVATEFESFFLGYMMKTMRASSGSSSTSFDQGVYQEMLDNQLAGQMATSSPLGLAPMIQKALQGSAGTTPTAVTLAAPATDTASSSSFSRVSSNYGVRQSPMTGQTEFHHGIDLPAPVGTAVPSASAGQVTFSGEQAGYGQVVTVDNGQNTMLYAHLSARNVTVGQAVSAGQSVGQVGSTGSSTGPHLHFEVREGGKSVDPTPWVTALKNGRSLR